MKKYIQKAKRAITGVYPCKNFRSIRNNFGLVFALKSVVLAELAWAIHKTTYSWIGMNWYNRHIARKCTDLFLETAHKYEGADVPTHASEHGKIHAWVFWWQGLQEAPDVVKACIASQKRNLGAHYDLHVLTKDNYHHYIELPQTVQRYVQQGKIALMYLSDFVRFQLLATWGGGMA